MHHFESLSTAASDEWIMCFNAVSRKITMMWTYFLFPKNNFLGIGSLDDELCSTSTHLGNSNEGRSFVLTACNGNYQATLKSVPFGSLSTGARWGWV